MKRARKRPLGGRKKGEGFPGSVHTAAAVGISIVFAACLPVLGEDWSRFRGDDGSGQGSGSGYAREWSPNDNVAWRTRLPGAGTSSPIVWGNRVYVTCYSGYGEDKVEPGDQSDLTRHLVALRLDDGRILFERSFPAELPESNYGPGGNSDWHGYSSSTPATDGEHVYVFFGKSGVHCLTMDGEPVWQAFVGDGLHGWGSGNSVVLFEDLVLVNASVESRQLIALDKRSGEEQWSIDVGRGCRNTPLVVQPQGGGDPELVISLPGEPVGEIRGLDPRTGELLWQCAGIPDGGYVCPSVIAEDGVVYAIGGRENTAIAVRAGGRGEVDDSHVLWRASFGSNVSSPVYHDGYLYWAHERRGLAMCLDATDGSLVYRERLEPRPGVIYASAAYADGCLYYLSQHEGTYVVAARPEFELLAHNTLDEARANASPVLLDGRILLRNDRYLYCIGSPAAGP